VSSGPVRALFPSPDGAALAFLDGCQEVKAQFLPAQTARCDLRVVPAGGGDAAKVAGGVTTLAQGVAWRPDGKALVAMADYDHAAAAATLVLWDGVAARTLAEGVTFHGYGKGGELGFVAGGKLAAMLPRDAAPHAVAGAERVASFDVAAVAVPECGSLDLPRVRLAVRRAAAAGGELLRVGCALERAEPLEAGQVGDYGFSRSGPWLAWTVHRKDGTALRVVNIAEKGAPVELGTDARSFAFGPDGKTLAFVAEVLPGKQGNLHLGGLGRKDAVLAREVGEFRWAADAPRLAWLERYDPRVRAGTLGAGGPDLAPRTVARNVSEFEVSPDGARVAFLQHTTRGGYSVDLGLAQLDPAAATTAATVATGAFGFAFSPDGRWLYYRTRCVRNAEACDLERIPAGGLPAGRKPERIAEGVKSFEFDPRDPGRLLVGWQRADLVALDVGVWEAGKLTRVDAAVLPGSARFLGPDSRRLAYVVVDRKRQGVYVAELPRQAGH
jgi:sugar lactone lactonase YvrE